MGILDTLRGMFTAPVDSTYQSSIMLYGIPTSFDDVRRMVQGQDPTVLFRQQPNLRTVITFMARNMAQLGIQTFQQKGETDRSRNRTDPVAQTLSSPNGHMTTYDLIYRLVADLALWDEAIWMVVEDIDRPSGWSIQPIPMTWVQGFAGGDLWGPGYVKIYPPYAKEIVRVPMEDVIYFHGWDPSNLHSGITPIESLKATISEQIHAQVYREQQWTRAGRYGAVVSRPKDAPTWTADQKRKFKELLDQKLAGNNGADAGASLLLEDGMTVDRAKFSAKEEQFIEAAKLALSTVAQVYHVNPTMIGQLDNANFSNVREFRRMLYGETLGPVIAQIEAALNAFLVPKLAQTDGIYVEFNVKEKLQGSFEEQAAVMSASTGGPWMTRAEARARENLPFLEGTDELIVPLNVVTGGQASPLDSTPDSITGQNQYLALAQKAQRDWGPVTVWGELVDLGEVKARSSDTVQTNVEKALKGFFKRQGAVVLSALGAKADQEWWDEARWNTELASDLFKLAMLITRKIGRQTAESLGFDQDQYNTDQTINFLKAVCASRAEGINGATKAALEASIGPDAPEDAPKPSEIFSRAEEVRSVGAAAALVTTFSAFATVEAAKQVAGPHKKSTKTWVVTSGNPRPEHSRMNGQTVATHEKFSNGADWPGDPVLGADGVAGCTCSVTVKIE